MKTTIRLTLITALLALTSSMVFSAQFYRWTDVDGTTFIQSYIPPEFVSRGYDVIDDAGNLIQRVPRAITPEERSKLEAEQLSATLQKARDEELIKLYRTPLDVDRSMNTWLSRMDMEIRLKEGRILFKQKTFDSLQETAANQEKAGRPIDPEIVEEMAQIEVEIEKLNREIRGVELRKDESKAEFVTDRKRMVILWEMIHNKKWKEK